MFSDGLSKLLFVRIERKGCDTPCCLALNSLNHVRLDPPEMDYGNSSNYHSLEKYDKPKMAHQHADRVKLAGASGLTQAVWQRRATDVRDCFCNPSIILYSLVLCLKSLSAAMHRGEFVFRNSKIGVLYGRVPMLCLRSLYAFNPHMYVVMFRLLRIRAIAEKNANTQSTRISLALIYLRSQHICCV